MKDAFQTVDLSANNIYGFLTKCDTQFSPFLSSRVNLIEYSEKLFLNSTIIHTKENNEIIGIVAFYANNNSLEHAFISLFCVLEQYKGNGIGDRLMNECITLIKTKNFKSIKLEVDTENQKAISFYTKFGFHVEEQNQRSYIMVKHLYQTT